MDLNLILIVGALFAITFSFLVYNSNAHWGLKGSVLAIALAVGMMSTLHYIEMLGAPIQAQPSSPFILVHHRISQDQMIYIWAITEEKGDRLYAIPYDRNVAQELEEAAKRQEQGHGTQAGEFDPETNGFRTAPGHELLRGHNPVKNNN